MRIPTPNRRARLPNMAVSRGNEFRSSRRSPTSTFWSSNAITPLHLQEGRADQPAVLYHGDSMSGYKGWRNFGECRKVEVRLLKDTYPAQWCEKALARDVSEAEPQRAPGSSSPLSKSSSMCSLAACTSSGLMRISSISGWVQLRRTYSSWSTSRRLAPPFRRWMMYWRTFSLRPASGPSPVPPINVSQNDPCSATATHSSCYPYRTPQSHTRIFASDNGRYSPTSWNAVKRKSNFGEFTFHALRWIDPL